jgi:hypothetical protein
VPAELNRWIFDIGNGTTLMANCNFQTTATTIQASLNNTCNALKSAAGAAASWLGLSTATYCDSTRSYTFNFNGTAYSNATLDSTYKTCLNQTAPYSNIDTFSYSATNTLASWTAVETIKCSFGAYIKASAMMVVAVVAATLF